MYFECLRILLEAQGDHRVEDVLATYCFPLLHLALLRGLRCDEADELRDTFLYAFFCLLGDFGCRGHGRLHDARHVRNLETHLISASLRHNIIR